MFRKESWSLRFLSLCFLLISIDSRAAKNSPGKEVPGGIQNLSNGVSIIHALTPLEWRAPIGDWLSAKEFTPDSLTGLIQDLPVPSDTLDAACKTSMPEPYKRFQAQIDSGDIETPTLKWMALGAGLFLSPHSQKINPLISFSDTGYSLLPQKSQQRVQEKMRLILSELGVPGSTSGMGVPMDDPMAAKDIRGRSPAIYARLEDGTIHSLTERQFAMDYGVKYLPSLSTKKEEHFLSLLEGSAKSYEQLSAVLKWLTDLYVPLLENEFSHQYYVGRIDNTVGNGLFAKVGISPLSVIGEYAGLLLNVDRGAGLDGKYAIAYPFDPGRIIDAKEEGNLLRFANHSTGAANARILRVFNGTLWKMILIATKQISPGRQILFDYGPYYWKIEKPKELHP